jgi:RHS repeat-associated protein
MDGMSRLAMIDSRTVGDDGTPAQLIRYQFANHLGTAMLELDDAAQIIAYEEYYPYGSTSFQSVDTTREVPARRYRYTGKERDEESGLYYHSARYYAPWIARWTAADPTGIKDGPNVYAYCSDNPVKLADARGTQGADPDEQSTQEVQEYQKFFDLIGKAVEAAVKDYLEAQRKAEAKTATEAQQEKSDFKETSPGRSVLTGPTEKQKAAALANEEQIAAARNRLRNQPIPGPDPTTLGVDTQVGGSAVGIRTDNPKGSVDYLQLTVLPRNFETIPIFFEKDGFDIAAFKEWGIQLPFQYQPKDETPGEPKTKNPGWQTHFTPGITTDVFNVSYDPIEFAITGNAGYDVAGGNFAFTGVLGGKLTLWDSQKLSDAFGTFKLRLYGGVGIKGDVGIKSGAPSGWGGISAGGGLLLEWNPFERKGSD